MAPHFIRFLGAIALHLIGDVAQPIALAARDFQRLRPLIEQLLLFHRLDAERSRLRGRVVDALHEIAEVGFRLLEERAETFDFAGKRRHLFAQCGRARRAAGEERPIFRELRFIGSELRGELRLRRLRACDVLLGRFLLRLREDDPSFVQRAFRGRELFRQLLVTPRLAGLALQRIQIARDFSERVVDAQQVLLRLFELQLRGAALRFVLRDAGRFLD